MQELVTQGVSFDVVGKQPIVQVPADLDRPGSNPGSPTSECHELL